MSSSQAARRVFASVLAALIVRAATAQGSPPAAESQPTPAAGVGYAFELLDGTPRRVAVELTVTGQASGESRFAVAPGWGGVTGVADLLHDLSAADAQGAALPMERDGDTAWVVKHAPGAPLRLRWELRPLPQDQISTQGNEYRPVVTDTEFHAVGETAFVWPEWLENPDERDVALQWRGFQAAGWKVACSHGPADEDGRLLAHTSLQGFRHAVFVAGSGLRLAERAVSGGTLQTAIFGDGWQFRDEEFTDLVARIVESERAFFRASGPPFYLVTLFPTPKLPHGFSLGGTSLTDSFALFVMDGISLRPDADERLRVARVLAHEHFHAWNGGVIAPAEPEQLGYWFSEGFTEFYAGRVLLAAGLITPAQRVAGLNEMLQGYWSSPVRNEPNARVEKDFWNDADVQKLPYQRGEIAAILCDDAIRTSSGGKLSLDDLMRELMADAPKSNRYTTDSMLERLQRWAGAAAADRVRAIVVDGADAVLPPGTWSPWVEVTTRPSAHFELGFDREATFKSGLVSGVRDGSAAFAAGLRNGQRAAGLSMGPPVASSRVTLTIREDDGPRDISWLPAGEPFALPALELKQPATGTF